MLLVLGILLDTQYIFANTGMLVVRASPPAMPSREDWRKRWGF